jgi:hypothetical protein
MRPISIESFTGGSAKMSASPVTRDFQKDIQRPE